MLGSKYKIIPFKKSRYYSFEVPTADIDIKCTEETKALLEDLNIKSLGLYFPTAISLSGELIFHKEAWIKSVISKIYGDDPHPLASHLLCADGSAFLAAKVLYDVLLDRYGDEIKPTTVAPIDGDSRPAIKDGYIVINNKPVAYDSIVSTIPLNALIGLCGLSANLESSNYHLFLVATNHFNLEGAQRVFIGDEQIPFWKVNVIGNRIFQFFANEPVIEAEILFSRMTKERYQILGETNIKEAFPLGAPPVGILSQLEKDNITCIGSNARWDYFYDIAASIKKLSKGV